MALIISIIPIGILGILCLLVWAIIKKNAKITASILISLFSLAIPMTMTPLFKGMEYFSVMPSASSFAPFTFLILIILLICAITFIVIALLSLVSAFKIYKAKPDSIKFVKVTFRLSAIVSAITLILVMFSPMFNLGFSFTLTDILFYQVTGLAAVEIICSSLTLAFGIAGLALLKEDNAIQMDETPKVLSNRLFLSITNIILLSVLSVPAGFMLAYSFFGIEDTKSSIIGIIKNLSEISDNISISNMPVIYGLAIVFILCALAAVITSFFNGISVIAVGSANPEKAQKFLKKSFFATSIVSVITIVGLLVIKIVNVTVTTIKPEYTSLFGKKNEAETIISRESLAQYFSIDNSILFLIIILLLVLALATLGRFLLKKSQIVSVVKKEKLPQSDNNADLQSLKDKIKNVSVDDISNEAKAFGKKTEELTKKTTASYQNAFSRAKQILLSPQTEYLNVKPESVPHTKVLTQYILPLAIIPALFAFIGYGLIGHSYMEHHYGNASLGFRWAIEQYLLMLGGIYITALIINALSDNFNATKNFDRAFSLVAYAYTPIFLGGIFHIYYSLWWLVYLVGLYGLYLLFVGLKPMMEPAEDKADQYSIISVIVAAVVYIGLSKMLEAIILP
jgi:hypothetical protein